MIIPIINAVLTILSLSRENMPRKSGMAATPKRASNCEAALIGQSWTQETIDKAMKEIYSDFEPLSDFRASKEYRSMTAANMLRRFFIEQNHQNNQIETRVTSYV